MYFSVQNLFFADISSIPRVGSNKTIEAFSKSLGIVFRKYVR